MKRLIHGLTRSHSWRPMGRCICPCGGCSGCWARTAFCARCSCHGDIYERMRRGEAVRPIRYSIVVWSEGEPVYGGEIVLDDGYEPAVDDFGNQYLHLK